VFDWRADPSWPAVDVVMPIRNEAPHLVAAVAAIQAQDYPGELCILMAVGPSTDGTDAVARELAAHHASVTVVDNPSGRTPTALNLAISAGTSPVVVRVDGHSQLSDGYIEQAIETLRRTGRWQRRHLKHRSLLPRRRGSAPADRHTELAVPNARSTPCTLACLIGPRSRPLGCSTST
jgi:glycosyltransferase involved in cell wall biosynthesis